MDMSSVKLKVYFNAALFSSSAQRFGFVRASAWRWPMPTHVSGKNLAKFISYPRKRQWIHEKHLRYKAF